MLPKLTSLSKIATRIWLKTKRISSSRLSSSITINLGSKASSHASVGTGAYHHQLTLATYTPSWKTKKRKMSSSHRQSLVPYQKKTCRPISLRGTRIQNTSPIHLQSKTILNIMPSMRWTCNHLQQVELRKLTIRTLRKPQTSLVNICASLDYLRERMRTARLLSFGSLPATSVKTRTYSALKACSELLHQNKMYVSWKSIWARTTTTIWKQFRTAI